MLRFLVLIVSFAFMAVVVAFAIANRGGMTVSLEPVPYMIEAPIYLVVLAAVGFGFVWGGFAAWTSGAAARKRARNKAYEASKARHEAAELRAHVTKLEATQARAQAEDTPAIPAPASDAA